MKETKVIKIKQVTYDRIIKLGKPYLLGDTIDTVLNRILDKLEFSRKKKRKKQDYGTLIIGKVKNFLVIKKLVKIFILTNDIS